MDTKNGYLYPIYVESKNYPFFGFAYHPEYQNAKFVSKTTFRQIKGNVTIEMMSDISRIFYEEALKNNNKFTDHALLDTLRLTNFPVFPYKVGTFHVVPGIGMDPVMFEAHEQTHGQESEEELMY